MIYTRGILHRGVKPVEIILQLPGNRLYIYAADLERVVKDSDVLLIAPGEGYRMLEDNHEAEASDEYCLSLMGGWRVLGYGNLPYAQQYTGLAIRRKV